MIKRNTLPIISEENTYNNQFFSWLNDSHYWIQQSEFAFTCKWCAATMPQSLNDSRLCERNPEILRILSKQDNPIKS